MKELIPYLLAIGASLIAIIVALFSKVQALRSKNSQLSANEIIQKALMDKEVQHEKANQAEQEYYAARDAFLRNQRNNGEGSGEGEL